jgi:hypothetical protein
MATLTKKEWDRIRGRRTEADVNYLFMLLQRLMLLFRLALRKSELAAIQFKHFGHDRKRLRVYGKGGTIVPVPVPDFIR